MKIRLSDKVINSLYLDILEVFESVEMYSNDIDAWSLLCPPNENGVIERCVAGPKCCREELMRDIQCDLLYSGFDYTEKAIIGKDGRCYFLLSIGLCNSTFKTDTTDQEENKLASTKEFEAVHNRVGEAVKLLNYFENKANWINSEICIDPIYCQDGNELTHLCNEIPTLDDLWNEIYIPSILRDHSVWQCILIVDNKWLTTPSMVSMLILIMRAGLFLSIKTIKQYVLGKAWKDCPVKYQSDLLVKHVKELSRYWAPLLKNIKSIFPNCKKDRFKYWKKFGYNDGIHTLFYGYPKNGTREDIVNLMRETNQALKLKSLKKC